VDSWIAIGGNFCLQCSEPRFVFLEFVSDCKSALAAVRLDASGPLVALLVLRDARLFRRRSCAALRAPEASGSAVRGPRAGVRADGFIRKECTQAVPSTQPEGTGASDRPRLVAVLTGNVSVSSSPQLNNVMEVVQQQAIMLEDQVALFERMVGNGTLATTSELMLSTDYWEALGTSFVDTVRAPTLRATNTHNRPRGFQCAAARSRLG
jgi:hypothetical protein